MAPLQQREVVDSDAIGAARERTVMVYLIALGGRRDIFSIS